VIPVRGEESHQVADESLWIYMRSERISSGEILWENNGG